MAASIKYDGTELMGATYIPRFVKHESAPDRIMSTTQLARDDGEVLVSSRYGRKTIPLQGILTASTQANLEAAVDTFKELFSRVGKNLDVDWNGSTRRYVATCVRHDFDRDHFHLLFVPWTAEFAVLSGEGGNTTTTKARNAATISGSGAGYVDDVFTILGSKPGRPVITVQGSNWASGVRGIEYKNTDSGERIVVTKNSSWGNDTKVKIDCDLRKVSADIGRSVDDFAEIPFYGLFPRFIVGSNNIRITSGGVVNQETDDTSANSGNSVLLNATTKRIAQAFSVPYGDGTFQGITLALMKTGTPGAITWRIETDNGNKPSGTLADANATGTIAAAAVSGSPSFVTGYSTNPWALTANTKYWIVASAAATLDGSNNYDFYQSLYTTYTRGFAAISTDSGSTYTVQTYQFIFKVRYGGVQDSAVGGPSVKHTVEYTQLYL